MVAPFLLNVVFKHLFIRIEAFYLQIIFRAVHQRAHGRKADYLRAYNLHAVTRRLKAHELKHAVKRGAAEIGHVYGNLGNVPILKHYAQRLNAVQPAGGAATTGSQGESMAALSRMAGDVHRKVTIQPNDTIIFSSNPIPGNEKAVSRVINELSAKGANVIFQDAHVSGHACQEELKLIYSLVKPKYAIPVHGEYRHLKANAEIAQSLGIPKENIFIIQSGDVIELQG